MRYTAGELASKLGISARTVRFYDEKKILLPCGYTEGGYRLYDEEGAERLQKILMLRFLDFTIEQIRSMMQQDGVHGKFDVRQSLEEQSKMLVDKKEHIERILQAVKVAKETKDDQLWSELVRIIEITKEREDVINQYQTDDNLKRRISIHDYSTAAEGFYPWVFRHIGLTKGMKILEIGCGNAAFWRTMAPNLPDDLEVHLTDYSDGMLQSAKQVVDEIQKNYPEKHLKFVLDRRDATEFTYPVYGFDRIMAHHVLFYLTKESRSNLYKTIQELLAVNGLFTCTLIGKQHMFELHQLLNEYYPQISIPSSMFDLCLENAPLELENYFSDVKGEEQKNDLLVPREEAVFDYVCSYSEEVKQILEYDRKNFIELIHEHRNEEGNFYIHKSTGIVVCKK